MATRIVLVHHDICQGRRITEVGGGSPLRSYRTLPKYPGWYLSRRCYAPSSAPWFACHRGYRPAIPTIPGFHSKHEAAAWIVQTGRLLQQAEPGFHAPPELPSGGSTE